MKEKEMRKHRCCFTGHRLERLTRSEQAIKEDLEREMRRSIDDGFNVFITGMARGEDIWVAEIVLQLRRSAAPVRLIYASPYQSFENSWSSAWQHRYRTVLAAVDLDRFICPRYNCGCFQIRNEWMVNHSLQSDRGVQWTAE